MTDIMLMIWSMVIVPLTILLIVVNSPGMVMIAWVIELILVTIAVDSRMR
jgi:hypothetical protein